MKLLCCNRYILILLFLYSSLFAGVSDKSAIVYYGEKISYPMVGVHDYIIVKPSKTDVHTHGFSIYRDKIYAYTNIDNADEKQLFSTKIEPLLKKGYKNFYFNVMENQYTGKNIKKALAGFINRFHKRYPDSKIILTASMGVINEAHNSVDAVLIDSYYFGSSNKKGLDYKVKKIKSYGLDIIDVEYLKLEDMKKADRVIMQSKTKGLIPYISNSKLDTYGKSSKNAIKREVLVLIDEGQYDRVYLSAHQHGALPLEYLGYMQKLHEINEGLPELNQMSQYAGVIVWLSKDYKQPGELIEWVVSLQKIGLKVVFASNFGASIDHALLEPLDINIIFSEEDPENQTRVVFKDSMMGYDAEPVNNSSLFLQPNNAQPLLTYEDKNLVKSTVAAIMPWGGYAIGEAFIVELNQENLWVINPFEFFQKALDLKPLPVPDTTTENGKRLLFTHVDGDGIMNAAEFRSRSFSGDIILDEIVKKYDIPHSISVIGAEIGADGLFPQYSKRLKEIVKELYTQENVEGASHTYSHPFKWGEIKNGELDSKYHLKVKGYNFSLDRELAGTLRDINKNLYPSNKSGVNSIFWSGDCIPREDTLTYMYERDILNINGGYTVISNSSPWLTNVSPLGLERGEYYQIYTGAQNENVYTNNWLGPFWGFKRVVQTFKLTDSPKRYKPIDIYYHIYSGSKRASLNALKYVFDWAIAQDVMPIYTSEYIPKVMDYYTASIAQEDNRWLVSGMNDLKTLRIEKERAGVDLKESNGVLGVKHFETHTYLHLDNSEKHIVSTKDTKSYKKRAYLVSANAKVVDSQIQEKKQRYSFDGYVDLKLEFNVPKGCSVNSTPKATETLKGEESKISLYFKNSKKAVVNVSCK